MAEIGGQAVRQTPNQHPTGDPIKDGAQIDEAPTHRNVRFIHRPNLIRAFNSKVVKQVGVDAVCLIAPTFVGLAVNGLDVELLHQRADMLAADLIALQLEHVAWHPRPGKRMFQM